MEVTTQVFGSDFPTDMIKYADIGFFRRRVKLGTREKQNDSFTIYLEDIYIDELAERLFADIFGERILDVFLNPCLMYQKIIALLIINLEDHHEKLQMLVEKKKLKLINRNLIRHQKHYIFQNLPSFILKARYQSSLH